MQERSVAIYEAKKAALARGDEAVTRQIGEGKDLMSILSTPTSLYELSSTSVSAENLHISARQYVRVGRGQAARQGTSSSDGVRNLPQKLT